jgi:hypothetical protein
MQYEQELSLLLEKLEYWTPERITHNFYSGITPPNTKYGNDWLQVWEDTDLGTLIITGDYYLNSKKITLHAKDGLIYRLNESYGEQDWNVWRDLYLTSFETKEFRMEVPIYYQLIPVGVFSWAFSVSLPPGGDLGIDILEEYLTIGNSKELFRRLVSDIDVFARNLKVITDKYSVGTSPHLYCGALRWLNNDGHYFMFPGNLTMTYEKAVTHGIAMMKIVQIGKLNVLHNIFYKDTNITDSEWNELLDETKQRWLA